MSIELRDPLGYNSHKEHLLFLCYEKYINDDDKDYDHNDDD